MAQQKGKRDAALERSFRERVPVDVWHEADNEPLGGVVLGLGPKWVLFGALVDGVLPNGYRVVRRRMIRRAKVFPLFVGHLQALGAVPSGPDAAIELGSTRDVLTSVGASRPAFSVHRDQLSPGTYLLGTPVYWGKRSVWILPVDPKARWERRPVKLRLRDITQVTFGSAYEDAILAVTGPRPEQSAGR